MIRALPFTLLLAGCVSDYDPGGRILDYTEANARSRYQLTQPIAKDCYSACTTKLSGNFAVQPDGMFYFHSASYEANGSRVLPIYDQGRAALPECARRLADSRGAFTSTVYVPISARQILSACPQLRVYSANG
jgi:hypothetical protein